MKQMIIDIYNIKWYKSTKKKKFCTRSEWTEMIKKMLERLKIKQKLYLGYFIVIGMMLLSGIISVFGVMFMHSNMKDYINKVQASNTAVKMCRIEINIAARNIREMALNEDSSTYASYRAAVEENLTLVNDELATIKECGIIDTELYNRYVDALNNWGTTGYSIIDKIEGGDRTGAIEDIFAICTPALTELVTLSQELDALTNEVMADAIAQSNIMAIAVVVSIVVFIILAVLLALTITKKIVVSIFTPLDIIKSASEELSAGNLHENIEYHSDDEIGEVAHNLRKSIRILGSYVDDISKLMDQFSQGNFSEQPEVEWKGDFVHIRNAFLEFEKNMADTVKGIQRVADQVAEGSNQVSASSTDLAQGATDQAAVTQELAATIVSVSEQVKRNAEQAMSISREVDNLGTDIISGNEKMQEMVKSMEEINNASNEISKIIAAINDIASQTNLLALNASIEAARAGEAGRGFAVVADQVSVLAAQSADAAKESAALIASSVNAVEKGMVVADATAKQLESVLENSKGITLQVKGVAEALEAQTEAMEQIDEGIDQINEVVQTNSATSEECAASSQEMSNQAENLDHLIRKFKVAKFK